MFFFLHFHISCVSVSSGVMMSFVIKVTNTEEQGRERELGGVSLLHMIMTNHLDFLDFFRSLTWQVCHCNPSITAPR